LDFRRIIIKKNKRNAESLYSVMEYRSKLLDQITNRRLDSNP
jgi:hypothetical protein